ncbi:unnamed protein product, partial [Heligmosomoides polygyrus]|uniref:Rho-GAP domain-containing protein n=1 Tax=Heligmosomoides polygyrus TaxID=6339 RepID=A0A183GUN5_HELPZ
MEFENRSEKEEWFELFSYCVQQCLRPLSTTITMDINVRGRKQVIRRRIDNGKKSGELVMETATDLGLSHTSYELRLVVGDGSGKTLQGPENVYVMVMSEIEKQGIRLSESQRQSLDACPIANARLILSNIKSSKSSSPMQIVNNIKKRVLQRADSRGFFGRDLDGPTPPQPVMSIVDHLRMNGYDMEGVFRECRSEMERGLVPDYKKYGTHVLASVLKDYLRSIPGKILLSGNYDLWIKEVVDEQDHDKKITACTTLLGLLPKAHSILLANVL